MPDGIFCRHMSFDNVTAEMTEGAIERCADDIARAARPCVEGFCLGRALTIAGCCVQAEPDFRQQFHAN